MYLKSASGRMMVLHTSIYIANWDIFAISLALLLKTVPVPALFDHQVMAGTKNLNGFFSLTLYDSSECLFRIWCVP